MSTSAYSELHLLASSGNFQCLRSLDLSDNEIFDLVGALQILQELKTLYSLHLEGNPCYVITDYKDCILRYFPNLVYLDNVKLLPEDRDIDDQNNVPVNYAAIIFTSHKILGLPAPPKDKKAVQKFYFEVSAPLLEDVIVEPSVQAISANVKKRDKSKSSKSSKKSKKGKAGSVYAGPDEYEENERCTGFKTERFGWSKVMQLPEDALVIESREGNYTDIRDTFRSTVNVKLIYLKTIPPTKNKGKSKGKKKGTKKQKSKGSKKKPEKLKQDPEVNKIESKEIVSKKLTLANFNCDLHIINWSDKTIDFHWASHPQFGDKAAEIEGSLRAFKYTECGKKGKSEKGKKGKKGKSKKRSKSADTDESKNVSDPQKLPVPNILTIHIGFGLKRSYNLDV